MKRELLGDIGQLKRKWDSLQPLSKENEGRLWRKFRLEWNYHSNHLEGNTLTYGETELLVIFGETRGEHSMREYEEMKAHDVAIARVRELAADSRNLTEADIRNLNKLILKETFWKEAITPSGEMTKKEITPGQYKILPNNVKTSTGETFFFAEPLEVPARMHEYIKLLNGTVPQDEDFFLHLSKVHHDFLLIHPFDDGNGRVARLIINYLLLRTGFTPIIIKTEKKKEYLSALHRADTEDRDYSELKRLLRNELEWSLDLGIRAAKGQSIDDLSDIEKEITLFTREQASPWIAVPKTGEAVFALWEGSIKNLFEQFALKTGLFRPLFGKLAFKQQVENETNVWEKNIDIVLPRVSNPNMLRGVLECEYYTGKSIQPFSYRFDLEIRLLEYKYEVVAKGRELFSAFYSRILTKTEIDEIISSLLETMLTEIKNATNEI